MLIRTRNLCKDYSLGEHRVQALRDVSVGIDGGEFVAVMGPSGSGKSTFMNLLGCLDLPSSGEYELAGELVAHKSADELAGIRNRRIGFVFQNFNLLARASALENAELPLIYTGVPAADRRRRALIRLAEMGLAERGHHTSAQLSGGQQQRVAIARALVTDPVLLLADEPTGALDSRTSLEIMAVFQDLNRKGITVVIVTHERDIAQFTRRILNFRDGRLVEDNPNPAPGDARALLTEAASA